MTICAYMYVSTSYGYVTSSLCRMIHCLWPVARMQRCPGWIGIVVYAYLVSKKDMRCLQVVSALLEGPSLP